MDKRLKLIVGATLAAGMLVWMSAAAFAVGRFVDDDSSIHESDIDWLAATGITQGCTNNEFCPEDSVTRAQMASFLRRFAQFLGAENGIPDEAANAQTLGGESLSDILGVTQGKRVISETLPDEGDAVTLRIVTRTAGSQPEAAMAEMSGYLLLVSDDSTAMENHQPLCWITDDELTTYSAAGVSDDPVAWVTVPAGTPGLLAGSSYYYTFPFTVTTAFRIEAGESKSLYFQCTNFRGFAGTETMTVRASAIASFSAVGGGALLSDEQPNEAGAPPTAVQAQP